MRNRLQEVLLSTTYAIITPILSLSSSSHPDEEEAVKAHTHVDQVLFMIILAVVVYEQGVGLKSSITVDTASQKDLTLQGCTNCPLRGVACSPISLSRARLRHSLKSCPERSGTTGPSN